MKGIIRRKAVTLFVLIGLVLLITSCKSDDYKHAEELFNNAEYSEALEIYTSLGDYEDSQEKAILCKYKTAETLYENQQYDEAIILYQELGDYEDSKTKASSCEREIGMRSNADYDFLSDIEASILQRMENRESDDYLNLVNTELAYLEKYSGKSFYDEELRKLALAYIEGLNTQKKALNEENMSDHQIEWQRGLVARYDVLNQLHDKYGLLDNNTDFIATYVMEYDYQKKMLEAYEAIDADIYEQTHTDEGELEVEYEYYDEINGKCTFTIKNNTDYTYSTVFECTFHDDNQVDFYKSSSMAENVKPGSSYVVTFYIDFTNCTTDTYGFDWNNYYVDVKFTEE